MKTHQSIISIAVAALALMWLGKASLADNPFTGDPNAPTNPIVTNGVPCDDVLVEYGWIRLVSPSTAKWENRKYVTQALYKVLQSCPPGRPCSCFPPGEPHPPNEANRLNGNETHPSTEWSEDHSETTGQETTGEFNFTANIQPGGVGGTAGGAISQGNYTEMTNGTSKTLVFPGVGPVKCGQRIQWHIKVWRRDKVWVTTVRRGYCGGGLNSTWIMETAQPIKIHKKLLERRVDVILQESTNRGCPRP